MAYYADVAFLSNTAPGLVERNADEFRRMHDLLESVKPTVKRVKDETNWEGAGRDQYDARLEDVSSLVEGMGFAFELAKTALNEYSPKLREAMRLVEEGQRTEEKLAELVSMVSAAFTRTAQDAEPMRRWEDISSTTGFFDWVAELGMDVDAVRGDAERYYQQTSGKFSGARRVEEEARRICLAMLRRARERCPTSARMPGMPQRSSPGSEAVLIRSATRRAGTRTPGFRAPDRGGNSPPRSILPRRFRRNWRISGQSRLPSRKRRTSAISEAREIKTTHTSSCGTTRRSSRLRPGRAAFRRNCSPVSAWREVTGGARWRDDLAFHVHEAAEVEPSPIAPESLPEPVGGPLDETSIGPLAVQVRRGAEVLGYDPENLTEDQRKEVVEATNDPKMNILISAQHLADIKAQSGCADVPPEQMTSEDYGEIGARYNGGPHWQNEQAQKYGHGLRGLEIPKAKKAME